MPRMTYLGFSYPHPVTPKKAIEINDYLWCDIENICEECIERFERFNSKLPSFTIRHVSDNKCFHCMFEHYNEIVAKNIEPDVKFEPKVCRNGSHFISKRIGGRNCLTCENERKNSPRQKAIDAGEKWYMPTEPCGNCGLIAERYVANGRCRNCNSCQTRKSTVTDDDYQPTPIRPPIPVDATPPHLRSHIPPGIETLSHDDAKALGFKVYRDTPTEPWRSVE